MREVNDITQDIINLGENIKELTKKQNVLVSLLCMERQKTNLLTRELEWMKSSAIGDFGAVILREVETIITSGQSCKCCLLAGRETNDDIVSTDEPFFDDSKSTDLVDHNESPEVVENEEIGYNLNVELKDESNSNEEPSVRTTTLNHVKKFRRCKSHNDVHDGETTMTEKRRRKQSEHYGFTVPIDIYDSPGLVDPIVVVAIGV